MDATYPILFPRCAETTNPTGMLASHLPCLTAIRAAYREVKSSRGSDGLLLGLLSSSYVFMIRSLKQLKHYSINVNFKSYTFKSNEFSKETLKVLRSF